MKKRLLSLVLALAMCLGPAAVPALAADHGRGFTDVRASDYFADAVQWAVGREVTTGTSATTFSPNETCTVAQILTFLYRANGSPQVSISNPFTDVSASDYYYSAALWAYQNGLVSGTTFGPSAPCTRSMVVTYLWKLAGSPVVSESDSGYAPYTISGEGHSLDNPGVATPMTITFSAASVTEGRLPYIDGAPLEDLEDTIAEQMELKWVTMITLQPGSTISFSNDFTAIEGSHGSSTFDYQMFTVGFIAVYGGSTAKLYYAATDMGQLLAGKAETLDEYGWGIDGWVSPLGFQDTKGRDYFIVYGSSAQVSSSGSSFSDVPSSASYAQAVAWAVEKGITTGDSANTFSPDKTCTRSQIVTFLYRALA